MNGAGRLLASPRMQRRLWGPGAAPLGRLAEAATQRHGPVPLWLDRPLSIAPALGTDLHYGQIARLVEEAAGWLHAVGVSPGDTVAIVKDDNVDVIALAEASARLGAVPALLAPEFEPLVMAILLRRLRNPLVVADAASVARHDFGGDYPARVVSVDATDSASVLGLDELRGTTAPPPKPRSRSDTVAVTHTSGTTGLPKLIRHTGDSLAGQAAVQVLGGRVMLGRHDVIGTCLTTAHARTLSGLPTIAAVGAPHLAMVDPTPSSVEPLLARFRPTLIETFPNVFLRWESLVDSPSRPFANVRIFLSTFDAAHPRTIRRLLAASRRRGALYAQAYAQSEIGAIALSFRGRHAASRDDARDVGWPALALTRVRIVDQHDRSMRRSSGVGRIQARGPGLFGGYVGEDGRTEAQRDGAWWNTGDLGRRLPGGRLYLSGRQADALPGINNPLAVEDVLLDRLPELLEVVVVANGDGQPVPVVSTRDDAPLDRDRWAASVHDQPFMAPPEQWRWEELPKTTTWKVRRGVLGELLHTRAQSQR